MAEVELHKLIARGWDALDSTHREVTQAKAELTAAASAYRALADRAEKLQTELKNIKTAHDAALVTQERAFQDERERVRANHLSQLAKAKGTMINEPGPLGASVHWLGDSSLCYDAVVTGVVAGRYTRRELNVRYVIKSDSASWPWQAVSEKMMRDVAYAEHGNSFIANTWHLPGLGCMMAPAGPMAPPEIQFPVPAQRAEPSVEVKAAVAEASRRIVEQTYGWQSAGLGRAVHYVNSAKTCLHAVVAIEPPTPHQARRLMVTFPERPEARANVKHRGDRITYSNEWEGNTWHTVSECSRAKRG